ncbi:type I phosphomannose isomerase catalytic subunit, partial [Mesorhizobium japonicum]|uniref:type I phosphomannose isomerase catalytic subunit n=1 Tax=Mesorhizobium japonicum TaxID=2066070 RepID=UPI003B5A2DC7
MFTEITNTPRDYAWGSTTAIARLLGRAPSGRPEAELWLGAHPGSPSRLVGREGTLLDVVDGRLPFLLKVLAAEQPLSLQAHPTPVQAEEGFAREEAAGIPIDAPERNYKDAFHKPELIYALSDPFRALCGFRPVEETRTVLLPVAGDPRIAPLLDRLRTDADLRPVVEWLITGGD